MTALETWLELLGITAFAVAGVFVLWSEIRGVRDSPGKEQRCRGRVQPFSDFGYWERCPGIATEACESGLCPTCCGETCGCVRSP